MSILADRANVSDELAAAPLDADGVQVTLVSIPVTCTPTALAAAAGVAAGYAYGEAVD